MAGPLGHIKVLELARVLAGPWASQTLADLGARVIKVEKPGDGDDTRAWGPPWAKGPDGRPTRVSAYFLSTNRGKRSVTIDFTRPEGQRLVQELALRSDVLIENFRVDGLAKYGLDYPSIHKINPRLIYCSITGFGQTGPYRHRPGYDFMIQGMGGLMSFTGEPDGRPGAGPMKVGVAVADIFTGLYATIGILGAIALRERTGEGQQIDLALLDSQVGVLANQALNYLVTGISPIRLGNAHPNIVPYQAFATADGYMILAVANDGQFAKFCEAAGRPELVQDPRFASNEARVEHREQMAAIVAEILATKPSAYWLEVLERTVPCGPINTVAQVFADPQVKARGMRLELPHPIAGSVPSVASPIKYSATPLEYKLAPPPLGANTDEILQKELNLSVQEIERLRQQGVI
ncbi:MAG TPA: CaiB/BaiF CoA-transferase family protein [Candidatus Binataceae bacterium]|nr:CaiB/BaiF CoA-transferase family protein [Candidatus Binataceae bacterium]